MKQTINHFFGRAAKWTCDFVGSATAFGLSFALIIGWAFYAAPHHFDGDSQMPINTITTIITFLVVFLIQNAQNRESRAMHLKIDELIKSSNARNEFRKLETLPDEDVDKLAKDCDDLPEQCG
jgi:low affinity Fe/Cu permease